jgi:hypothetical protein
VSAIAWRSRLDRPEGISSVRTVPFTQQDPIGLAGGLNLYGFANGDPVNFSDPFGLCPCVLLVPAAAGAGGLTAGAVATYAGAATLLAAGAAYAATALDDVKPSLTDIGHVFSGRHRQAVNRVNKSLEIAAAHLGRIASMPPDQNDPDFVRDMLDHAQKHINNAKKNVENAVGRTRRARDCRILHYFGGWSHSNSDQLLLRSSRAGETSIAVL